YNVYELTNALSNRDMTKLSKLLQYMSSHPKESPFPFILSVLYGFFSKIAAMHFINPSSKEALKSLGVLPWVEKEYRAAFQVYGSRINEIMDLIQNYDLRFKGVDDTGTEEGDLLKELVMQIATMPSTKRKHA
ncbi:MAG: DNA polymerase III subunit delta, partial [Bacteroidota bacterium]|nr:DNA polymerase III subunit delta [Bacteroidota bacterium]